MLTKEIERIGKDDYYLGIALSVSARSTCLRRRYGAVIVNHDEIVSTGYNGPPRGTPHCEGMCERDRLGCAQGTGYEFCKTVHAEQNAIISAARRDMIGGTLYLTGFDLTAENPTYADPIPCNLCWRMIKNAGIVKVVGRSKDGKIVEYDPEKDAVFSAEPKKDLRPVDYIIANRAKRVRVIRRIYR